MTPSDPNQVKQAIRSFIQASINLDGLGDEERRVYEALPGRGAATVDEIAVAAAVEPARILAPLAMLEVAGLAERHDGRWRIVRNRTRTA